MAESSLITRLSALRTTVRRRLVAYGLCVVAAGGVAAFLAVVTLDWCLWLPGPLRVVGGGLYVVGFVWAMLHWVIRPARAELSLEEVAARLETYFGSLGDRLVSTVNFLESAEAGSAPMMRKVVANTEDIIKDLPLESALSRRPLLVRGGTLLAGLSVLTLVMTVAPHWAQTGFYRYLYPWGDIEWPRTVSILPTTGDQVVAVGDSVALRMTVQRGGHETLRALVHLRDAGDKTTTLAMQRDSDGSFYTTIDAVTEDLSYWFSAGDDRTQDRPYLIRVVRRPEVMQALASVLPPPYASRREIRVHDLADGPVDAPIGGPVLLMVRSSKPVHRGADGQGAGLWTEEGEFIALTPSTEDPLRLSVRLEITRDVDFRIELRDADGFENRRGTRYSIRATRDTPPSVTVLEPRALTELTPRGSVPLVVRVEDDFGVVSLNLHVEHLGGRGNHTISLTDSFELALAEVGTIATARYSWSIEPLEPAPGDFLIYRAVATDNRSVELGGGQVGQSATMRIKVISDLEFETRVRSDLASLGARIRQAALDETELVDQTRRLERSGDALEPLTESERDTVAALAGRQGRLIRRIREFVRRFDLMAERVERNRGGDHELRSRLTALRDSLHTTAAEPMAGASAALSETRERTESRAQQERVQAALHLEKRAVEQLQSILFRMSQWTTFQELVTEARDLLDRQQALQRRTARLGKTLLGKRLDLLTEAEASDLRRTVREQEQLTADVEKLMSRMMKLATVDRAKDPGGAEAIDAALRIARARELTRHLREAVEAIRSNRSAAATLAQKSAANTIAKMAATLRERDRRELEELRKRIQRAQDQVAYLIEQQQAVRAATHEAGLVDVGPGAWATLEREQRTVRSNTSLLVDEVVVEERQAPAARALREAVVPMSAAETRIQAQSANEATVSQDDALTLLRDALGALERLADETAEELARRSLEQIRENLEAILVAQRSVQTGIVGLREAIAERGRLGRSAARAASRLAREQAQVRTMVEEQVGDFERVVVFKWALERVAGWMDESRNRLTARRIDDELAATSGRIVRELEKLIRAIVDTQSLPIDTQFVESEQDGSGGGRGGGAGGKPVPTVAELLVLKAMQVDINERTREVQGAFDPSFATEAQLRAFKALGEDQVEVRRLTEMVTRRASGAQGE